MSALAYSLLNPLDFLTFVQILQYMKLWSLLYTSQVYVFNHSSKSFHPLELQGVTSVVDCVKCVPIPGIKPDDLPLWVDENWTTHPLQRTQKLMTHPLSAQPTPQYFLTSPLDKCLAIANAKGWYGQEVPHPCLVPFPFRLKYLTPAEFWEKNRLSLINSSLNKTLLMTFI